MQDRFIGDVGDFEKYGLLRALAGVHPPVAPELSLGVVWYRMPDKNTDFLKDPQRFRNCDPPLFDELKRVVGSNQRTIAAIQNARIWPRDKKFFDEPVGRRVPTAENGPWLDAAVKEVAECDLVFLDPDNGLEIKTTQPCKREHCSFKDVLRFWEQGSSLVIYQHQRRGKSQAEQMAAIADELAKVVGTPTRPWYLHFKQRAFFVIPSPTHHDTLKARFRRFTEDWCSRAKLGNGPA